MKMDWKERSNTQELSHQEPEQPRTTGNQEKPSSRPTAGSKAKPDPLLPIMNTCTWSQPVGDTKVLNQKHPITSGTQRGAPGGSGIHCFTESLTTGKAKQVRDRVWKLWRANHTRLGKNSIYHHSRGGLLSRSPDLYLVMIPLVLLSPLPSLVL